MTAQLNVLPNEFLSDEFTGEDLHPADLTQVIEAAFDYYDQIPAFTKLKKLYRTKYNILVSVLSEKRDGLRQFNFIR